jgi:hypothetical protein
MEAHVVRRVSIVALLLVAACDSSRLSGPRG